MIEFFPSRAELEAGIDEICNSPRDEGSLELIVRRPKMNLREELVEAEFDPTVGLVGDRWKPRGISKDDSHRDNQLTIINSRVIGFVAREKERWSLAGDQLYLDLDLTRENLPPGTRLALGSTVIEITDLPHLGCRKFARRFGVDALEFVNSQLGKKLQLRGVHAKVVEAGMVRVRDVARKLEA